MTGQGEKKKTSRNQKKASEELAKERRGGINRFVARTGVVLYWIWKGAKTKVAHQRWPSQKKNKTPKPPNQKKKTTNPPV